MSDTEKTVMTETHGRVGLIRMNRPKQLNAFNDTLMNELGEALLAFDADPEIGAIVLTGSSKAFSAGADISAMQGYDFAGNFRTEFISRNWETILRVRKPVIAAVEGVALGGGCEMVMMCDIVIASETARFAQPEVKLGVTPGVGATQRLPSAVGKAKAMDWLLTGKMVSAYEAEHAGLVSRVVPAEETLSTALQVAAEIAAMPPTGCYGHQGGSECVVRDQPDRRGPFRAAHVSGHVLHIRSERGHGSISRKAPGQLPSSLRFREGSDGWRGEHAGRSYFRTAGIG